MLFLRGIMMPIGRLRVSLFVLCEIVGRKSDLFCLGIVSSCSLNFYDEWLLWRVKFKYEIFRAFTSRPFILKVKLAL